MHAYTRYMSTGVIIFLGCRNEDETKVETTEIALRRIDIGDPIEMIKRGFYNFMTNEFRYVKLRQETMIFFCDFCFPANKTMRSIKSTRHIHPISQALHLPSWLMVKLFSLSCGVWIEFCSQFPEYFEQLKAGQSPKVCHLIVPMLKYPFLEPFSELPVPVSIY